MVAVVVTWNRRELLEEALAALGAQSHVLEQVVVVDNASTDGTDGLLSGRTDLDVVRLATNTGGAGGFAVGIERALTHEPELVWLLDDDTIPTPDAARELVRVWQEYDDPAGRPPVVLASKVVWTDGRDHPMNTPRQKPGASRAEVASAARLDSIPIRSASFVSIMCDAGAVRERGLPIADYFLWNDDFEYSTRLIRDRVGLYVPGQRGAAQDEDLRLHRRRPGGAVLLRGAQQGLAVHPLARTEAGGEGGLRRLDAAPLGAHLRPVAGPTHAAHGDAPGARRRPAQRSAAQRDRAGRRCVESHTLPPGEPFALLISTYAGDRPDYLRAAFVSTVHDQTRRPAQVVLVQDGPVSAELAAEIARLMADSPVPVTHVEMPTNVGLGPALDAGLRASEHEIVARMDADDVSVPDAVREAAAADRGGCRHRGLGPLGVRYRRSRTWSAVVRRPRTRTRSAASYGSATRSTTRPWSTGAAPSRPPGGTPTWH